MAEGMHARARGWVSFGAIGPKAPAALVSSWSRTWQYVARHVGSATGDDIIAWDAGLAADLSEAAASLRPLVPNIFAIPWEHRQAPSTPMKQRTLLQNVYRSTRKNIIEQMRPAAAAQLRSCGGPGAGGFLTAPADNAVWMTDVHFRAALARRLGGYLRAAQGFGAPACQHRAARGKCSMLLDDAVVHVRTCVKGGHIIRRQDRIVRWLQRWLSQGRSALKPA